MNLSISITKHILFNSPSSKMMSSSAIRPLFIILATILTILAVTLISAEKPLSGLSLLNSRNPCPDEYMVPLPNNNQSSPSSIVCMDKYEAAVFFAEYGHWVLHPFNVPVDSIVAKNTPIKAVSCNDPSVKQGNFRPQAYISQVQATLACKTAGKRLCSEQEFYLGCAGPLQTTYPYGNTYQKNICNVNNQPSPIQRLFGPNPTYNFTELNDPRCDLLLNSLAPGGKFSACTNNITGTFDMAGNLDEWISTVQADGRGIFLGGYFVLDDLPKYNGDGCFYKTVAHDVTYHDYSLGFRCCADV